MSVTYDKYYNGRATKNLNICSRPTSFGEKYGHFSFFCKQMDIFQEKFTFLERLPQRQHFLP